MIPFLYINGKLKLTNVKESTMYSTECEKPVTWQPKEIIDLGDGCKIGITTNDGYYTVLLPGYNGSWKPTNWIPARAAKRLGELATIQIAVGSAFSLIKQPILSTAS
jgi:hypothetical protein